MAFDEAVGVSIERRGIGQAPMLVPHLYRTPRRGAGIVAQRHLLTDQRGIDFVDDTVQADGAIALHPARHLEQEQLVKVKAGLGEGDLITDPGPALERRVTVEAAVRGLMVLALDIGPQPSVQRGEARRVLGREVTHKLRAHGAEPAFHFALALRAMGPGVDEGHTELGAHQRQVLGAVVGAVVDIQALRQAAAHQRLLEHRQEGGGVLGQGKGGIGHHPRGVVYESDEVSLAPGAPLDVHGRAVHHVAHPQLAGTRKGEAAPVIARRCVGALAHQSLAHQQTVDRGGGQRHVGGNLLARAGVLDDGAH